MSDVSDLFFAMASIVIFSVLVLQANHFVVHSDQMIVDHEYENTGIALAQSIVDEARSKPFDEVLLTGVDPETLPGGFRQQLGAAEHMSRGDFAVFDHFHGYRDTVETSLGFYELEVTVTYVEPEPPFQVVQHPTFSKQLTARVRPLQSEQSVRLQYVKTYF
ncbi:hypothetical protein QA596_12130 [Balneolales bacterium ANBcel1]|nr:hypothetical protein [Balneolales bacterium ANBcel1]